MKQINLTLMLLCAAFLSTFSLNAQQVCNGGEVTAFGGAQTVYTCPSDGKPDVVGPCLNSALYLFKIHCIII